MPRSRTLARRSIPANASAPEDPGLTLKFPRPKVLVIDAPDVADTLASAGYAATKGTFGTPLLVDREAGYRSPRLDATLPNHTEQEIIVVDLAGLEAREARDGDFESPAPGVRAMWAPTERGRVDPRLPSMYMVHADFNRIHEHGGIFIVFAAPETRVRYVLAARDYHGLDRYDRAEIDASNWGLLSRLGDVTVRPNHGSEIELADNGYAENLGIASLLRDAAFECTLHPATWVTARWATLATSKYGDPVSGIIGPDGSADSDGGEGWIFLFPQVRRRGELVRELVEHVLPNVAPALFPHVERETWTRRREYERPEVTALKDEIHAVEEAARTRVRELEEGIARERERFAYHHKLLTATDDALVQAVITSLKALGFEDVRDVDADAEAAGDTGPKREDIRIMDADVPVLVEVKGIGGLPKEANALQVAKYLAPRMREWGRTDIKGLSIVNHQRHLPALDREHDNVFQPDVVTNAEQQGFGLLTTWDLYRLVRSFIALNWRHEDVAPHFTTPGRVRPVPRHYEPLGHIDGFWEQAGALGLRVEHGRLARGDRVAYDLPVEFVEEKVESLQLDDEQVETADAGAHVGLRTELTKQQARKGAQVYRVRPRELLGAG